ncbi:MAG: DUF4906 domain-containing protein [Bacteroides sp.]|nr:DUF4906 domain-containing protein [Bacteroides sp.]
MKRNLLYLFSLCSCLLYLVACQEEELFPNGGRIPEGTTTIQLTTQFKPMQSALTRTAGNAIQEIQSLYVLLYDEDGRLVSSHPITVDGGKTHTDADDCETFDLTVPYGIYSIYAVANVNNFLTVYDDDIQTEDGLKRIQFKWNNATGKAGENRQMFGYFTTSRDNTPNGFAAPDITINQSEMSLHAWLRRLASKVTIAFDGSQLNENVYIYPKSVRIMDIPDSCFLGQINAPAKDALLVDGETLTYSMAKENSGVHIAKGSPFYYYGASDADRSKISNLDGLKNAAHTAGAQALFFYENMQGKGEVKKGTKKVQEDTDNNQIPDAKDEKINKDNKPYGTYVEVKAYYENTSTLSRGEIVYRFMLGKDTEYNFDAERNYHYKLTLRFNKNANEVDWHVDYDEVEGIYAPNPYYISYDYNQPMLGGLPIRIVGDLKADSKLKIEIVKNNWRPDGAGSEVEDLWLETTKSYSYNNDGSIYLNQDECDDESGDLVWTGFLSLRDDELGMNVVDDGSGNFGYVRGSTGTNEQKTFGYRSWKYAGPNKVDLGNISYNISTGTKNPDGSTKFSVPLYTRPRKLWIASGFTGANPYVGYNRTATVRITATLSNNKTIFTDIKVVQVKRLVNPAGIYREKEATAFNVILMEQTQEGGNFTPIRSLAGPWEATIEAGNWFTLDGKQTVTGNTDSEIKFTYMPNSANNSTTPRYGIIKVTYHNNTCIHRIFVRQGYQPLDMGNGTKWLAYNMYSKNGHTGSPLEEGSFYKYNNWNYPIEASNNDRDGLKFNEHPGTTKLWIVDQNDTAWGNITNGARTGGFSNPKNTNWRLPREADWRYFVSDCKQGYGVLYGDGATEPAEIVADAYGYTRNTENSSKKGMRGCFVYKTDGKNLFFPIGKSGYGVRNEGHSQGGDYDGVLRYGSAASPLSTDIGFRPLLYDLYRQEGAIYWMNNSHGDAWDINYRTMDFNIYIADDNDEHKDGNGWDYGEGTASTHKIPSDACFVRCVMK